MDFPSSVLPKPCLREVDINTKFSVYTENNSTDFIHSGKLYHSYQEELEPIQVLSGLFRGDIVSKFLLIKFIILF